MRPDLQVWVITGDGDALSMGGNHLMHAMRRNVDIKILLFNNRIYGLTKGQYSPTSLPGHVTRSTPYGSVDAPLHPLSIALGSEATFVARSVDTHTRHLGAILRRAAAHRGTAFVEIYQNCNVYNDGAFDYAKEPKLRSDALVEIEHGQPLVFGTGRDKGIRLEGFEPRVVPLDDGGDGQDLLVHDETAGRADPRFGAGEDAASGPARGDRRAPRNRRADLRHPRRRADRVGACPGRPGRPRCPARVRRHLDRRLMGTEEASQQELATLRGPVSAVRARDFLMAFGRADRPLPSFPRRRESTRAEVARELL